jgi:hypothetical protein
VHYIRFLSCFLQLEFEPADICHSSLRTMAANVGRAMLQGNNEALKKSFAEGTREQSMSY